MLRPGQFTLKALFIATAFFAAACALVQFVRVTGGLTGLLASLSVPVLVCGAVGVLRGRILFWISYGVLIALGLLLVVMALVGSVR